MPKGTNEYHGDENEIAYKKQKREENNPNDEPNFDDKESDDE